MFSGNIQCRKPKKIIVVKFNTRLIEQFSVIKVEPNG